MLPTYRIVVLQPELFPTPVSELALVCLYSLGPSSSALLFPLPSRFFGLTLFRCTSWITARSFTPFLHVHTARVPFTTLVPRVCPAPARPILPSSSTLLISPSGPLTRLPKDLSFRGFVVTPTIQNFPPPPGLPGPFLSLGRTRSFFFSLPKCRPSPIFFGRTPNTPPDASSSPPSVSPPPGNIAPSLALHFDPGGQFSPFFPSFSQADGPVLSNFFGRLSLGPVPR